MVVRQLRRLGAARIDHDQGAPGIGRDLAQDRPCAREPVRLPRVLADEHRDLGALEIAGGVAARATVELAVDPELPRLLLGERVRGVDRAEGLAGGGAVRPAEMIPLPAATVVEDGVAAVSVANRGELGRHLRDRGVPVDRLEGAVGASPERRLQAVRVRLVEVEALGLLARVALRAGMRAVAAHARDVPSLGLDLDAAVDAAQDAGGLPPRAGRAAQLHRTLLGSLNELISSTRELTGREARIKPPSAAGARRWLRTRPAGSGRCGCLRRRGG
jgi:hypothetical protein